MEKIGGDKQNLIWINIALLAKTQGHRTLKRKTWMVSGYFSVILHIPL